ncbi:hypothetical protein SBDP1_1310028 [Syntrophobacter sp. SbD1]|nr:hypothetical protein SBDP1_1310028 [Syntrophobacter sp. SbD1]
MIEIRVYTALGLRVNWGAVIAGSGRQFLAHRINEREF